MGLKTNLGCCHQVKKKRFGRGERNRTFLFADGKGWVEAGKKTFPQIHSEGHLTVSSPETEKEKKDGEGQVGESDT